MPVQGVYRNAIAHAAKLAGEEQLARRLRVSRMVLDSWLSGSTLIPSNIFLAVADYLAEIRPPEGSPPGGSKSG
ncbi:MAG: hypothetical protein EPO20_08250 [Betaproteobacteria bacterium]|nr:MAG: hypothetical protein EPO20_08250 [Betaproteobacteria bacterium]